MKPRYRPRTDLVDNPEANRLDFDPGVLKEPPPPAHRGTSNSFVSLRRANPASVLLPRSRRWMNALPEEFRPVLLAERYPRLVNVIALEWTQRAALGNFIVDLLVDTRGGRSGFSVEIQRELRALLAICYEARDPSPL